MRGASRRRRDRSREREGGRKDFPGHLPGPAEHTAQEKPPPPILWWPAAVSLALTPAGKQGFANLPAGRVRAGPPL